MRWTLNVARIRERRGTYSVSVWKPKGKNHLEDLGIDGRIIRKMDLRDVGKGHGLNSSGSGYGQLRVL